MKFVLGILFAFIQMGSSLAAVEVPQFQAPPTIEGTAAAPVDSTWEELSNSDGIVIYRRKREGSHFVEFRGEGVIDASIAKVLNVLTDTPRKLEWVDRAVEAKDISLISQIERIEYNHSAAPWPVKDRDFLFRVFAYPNLKDHSVLVTLKSVEHAAVPEKSCCVRGELESSSYFLKSIDSGKKTATIVQIHADPKGSVPSWIVNLIQKSWPRKTLESLRAQVAKPDVHENEYFKSLLEASPIQK